MLRAKTSQLSFYSNHIYDRIIPEEHFLFFSEPVVKKKPGYHPVSDYGADERPKKYPYLISTGKVTHRILVWSIYSFYSKQET